MTKLPGFIRTGEAAAAAFTKENRKAEAEKHTASLARAVAQPPDPQNLFNPNLTFTDLQIFEELEKATWKFARTYADTDRPHSYTLRKHWTGSIPFENVLDHILTKGTKAEYITAKGRKYPNVYLRVGGMRFWNGPYPEGLPMRHAWLINRDTDTPSPFVRYLE